MADKTINELTAATTMGNDDLLVLQQGGTAKKLSGKQLGDYVYNAAAEKVAEVNQAVDDARSSINDIVESVQSMIELGTDTTLTTTGMAADAKAAGDKIKAVETAALADLSQGTASGSIVTITDGADNIPVKKMTVDIEPVQDLHGYDHPWPAGGGKNLLNITAITASVSGITITVNKDAQGNVQSVNVNGTASEDILTAIGTFDGESGSQYVLNGCPSGGGSNTYRLDARSPSVVGIDEGSGSSAFSVNGTVTVYLRIANGASISNKLFYPMVRLSTVSDDSYSPYSNICPITGFTGVNVQRTRKNLLPSERTISADAHAICLTGGETYSVSDLTSYIFLKAGTYTISYGDTMRGSLFMDTYDGTTVKTVNYGQITSKTFTISEDSYIKLRIYHATYTFTDESIVWTQLELGSTATAYEPYAGATYDITFPSEAGTVYGGSLEVNQDGSGTLTVDKKGIDLGLQNWNYETANSRFSMVDTLFDAVPSRQNGEIYSDRYRYNANIWVTSGDIMSGYCGIWDTGSLYVRDFNYDNAASLKTALSGSIFVYELATPQTYFLTAPQVTTLLGLNNIWSDTGDITEFVYRKAPVDPSYVDVKIAEADETTRAAIESMIAGRETTMKATKNYTSGGLVIVNDTLYKLDANVASGESLIPEINCHITTVAAVIASRVPSSRTVNGKALSSDIALTAEDIAYDDSLSEHTSGSVGEVVSDLKESINTMTIVDARNELSDGYIISANGGIHAPTGENYEKYTTDFYLVDTGTAIKIDASFNSAVYRAMTVYGYDFNKKPIALINYSEGGAYQTYNVEANIANSSIKFIRVSLSTFNKLTSLTITRVGNISEQINTVSDNLQNKLNQVNGIYNFRDSFSWSIGTINADDGSFIANNKRITTDVCYANQDLIIPVNTNDILFYLETFSDINMSNPAWLGIVSIHRYTFWRISYIIPRGTFFKISARTVADDTAITTDVYNSELYKNTFVYSKEAYFRTVRASNNRNIIAISHQGLGKNPEEKGNSTPSAIKNACLYGFDYVETDVWFSSDNIPVCCHDQSFTDSVTGETVVIADHTAAELKTYNFYGETILTFDELTQICKLGGIGIVFDHLYYFTEAQCNIIFNIVKKYCMQDKMIWLITKTTLTIAGYVTNFYAKSKFSFCTWGTDVSEDIQAAITLKTSENTVYISINADNVNSTTLQSIIASAPSDIGFIAFTVDRVEYLQDLIPYVNGMLSNTMNPAQYVT